jgi:hypothetical protein
MTPEFSRRLVLARVGPDGRQETLDATREECVALARRFGISDVGRLHALLRLHPAAGGGVEAKGRLQATVTQDCVVTLDPVEQTIEEDIRLLLLPPGREPADGPDDMDEVPSDPAGVVDLGEALAEQLALALDPYPRAPGAMLPGIMEAASPSPFAALAGLRRDRQ